VRGNHEDCLQVDQSPVPQRSFLKKPHMLEEKQRNQKREGVFC
jgi:hypothetical protein